MSTTWLRVQVPLNELDIDYEIIKETDPYATGDSPTIFDVEIHSVEFNGYDIDDWDDEAISEYILEKYWDRG